MEADLDGPQRKVMASRVYPAKRSHGEAGIPLRNGRTLPFVVSREWSAPAGHYVEGWYLVHPETREVLLEGPQRDILVWGLQSLTELRDEVTEAIRLQPGKYLVVFSLGGIMGGQVEVETIDVPAEEAA
jgi:hypothetical protein